jgi:radical SAM protein with 4Fe4S-binding SPASM domain
LKLSCSMVGSFKDSVNLLSKTSFLRMKNAASIYKSYQHSKITRNAAIQGLPITISIEPTTSCNLRCPECPSGLRAFTRPTGMLKEDLFTRIIDELSPTLTYLTFYFQGEPYLNPQFLSMVQYASTKRVYTATSTNGHYLNDDNARATVESGLDRLIISIDGTTQETYESYRVGGQLEKVIGAAENIVKWKRKLRSKTPHVVFQFLVVKPNEHEIGEVYKIAKRLSVDQVVLKTAQIYDYQHGSPLIPDNEKYSRYKKEADGSYALKNQMLNECWKMWHSCVITWDGKVVPCCFDKDASHVLGDLNTSTFRNIWYSARYATFRQSLLKSRSDIEICKNCTEGTKVWA